MFVITLLSFVLLFQSLNSSTSWKSLNFAKPSQDSFSVIYPEVHEKLESIWKIFKNEFNKEYTSTIDEIKHYFQFAQNYVRIMEHNIRYEQGKESYMLSINSMADMEPREYKHIRGYKPSLNLKSRNKFNFTSSLFIEDPRDSYPESIDWRKKGAVTEVKNQGQCGSCWAFSTTGSLEGQNFRKTNKLLSLSEQQLVDCASSYGNNGCNGGLMDYAFEYIKNAGGIESEDDYPYTSGNTTEPNDRCQYNKKKEVAEVTGFVDIPSGDEEKLMKAVAMHGPVSVAIDASHPSFQMYHKGIYSEPECKNEMSDLDHGVLVVGYGSEKGKDYWIVKNSWGTSWGEHGYIRIRRNHNNLCGVATAASYPLV